MKLLKAFDHIAGSALGASSDAETIIDLLSFIEMVENNPGYNEVFPPMDKHWKEFAVDMVCNPDNLDVEYYADLVDEYCNQALPLSCCFAWHDGEYIIEPFIDECAEQFEEVPDNLCGDYIYTVNDHGNVTCYEWRNGEYLLLWDMV